MPATKKPKTEKEEVIIPIVNITEEAINDDLKMDELIGIQRGDFATVISVMARFTTNMTPAECKKYLGALTLNEFTEVAAVLREAFDDAAASKN